MRRPVRRQQASWRALERAGFRHIADLVDDAHGQSRLMVIDRPRQELVVAADDPRAADVRDLLAFHLALAREVTPPGHVHALDIDGLLDPAVTFVSARRDGALLGVGALRRLDDSHGEIKSMHVRSTARGAGIGRAIVDHLLALAVTRGHRRVSLETGTNEAFGPARALYASVGFVPCEPFGSYTRNPYSTCMTIELDRRGENRNTTRSESWR